MADVITFIAFFAILFTGRYPRGLFDFVVNIYRWQENVFAYYALFRDEYPPFSWEAGKYPVTFEVDYPESLSRWMIFVKWLLAIPHIIVLAVLVHRRACGLGHRLVRHPVHGTVPARPLRFPGGGQPLGPACQRLRLFS